MKSVITVLCGLSLLMSACTAPDASLLLLVGTYTRQTDSRGIYLYEIDPATGHSELVTTAKSDNPSYLALSPDGGLLYAVNECGTESKVSVFACDSDCRSLRMIDMTDDVGDDPCYVSVSERHLITANYSSGSVSVFARAADSSLRLVQTIQHYGHGLNPERQAGAHVHQTIFAPDNDFVLVSDLGTDQVYVYRYLAADSIAPLQPTDSLALAPGSGPRHIAFHPDGTVCYVLQEISGTLSTLSWQQGELAILNETTVVADTTGEVGAADIHLSPDGRFLYASNRGSANDISCFAIDDNHLPQLVEHVSTGGRGPRNFTLTADGRYLLAANQYSNNIVIFGRDADTGKLQRIGKIDTPSPVCLVWAR